MPKNDYVIPAHVASDDGEYTVKFDAEPWFKQATPKDIRYVPRRHLGDPCYDPDRFREAPESFPSTEAAK